MTSPHPLCLPLLRGSTLGTPHGTTNRAGGCSAPPFSSLNLSYGVGDLPANVTANRQLVKQALGATFMVSAEQVHGNRIFLARNIDRDTEVKGYDALITDQPGVALLIQQADCQAVLLHDPEKKVIAAVHCGWRGNVSNLIATVVAQMQEKYGCRPASLRALISPSLGPCCAEFNNFAREFPPELHSFQVRPLHFDLWQLSTAQLRGAGALEEHIEIMGICTSCRTEYFSYRRSRRQGIAATGRNGSAILLAK